MASDVYDIELRGLADVRALLNDAGRVLDVDRVVSEAGAILLNRIKRRYLQQVNPDGTPWEPSQAARDRAASGRDGGTLFDTGILFQSIASFRPRRGEFAIGTDVFYGVYHNDPSPGSNNVQRVFLGFGDEDVAVVRALITQRIAGLT